MSDYIPINSPSNTNYIATTSTLQWNDRYGGNLVLTGIGDYTNTYLTAPTYYNPIANTVQITIDDVTFFDNTSSYNMKELMDLIDYDPGDGRIHGINLGSVLANTVIKLKDVMKQLKAHEEKVEPPTPNKLQARWTEEPIYRIFKGTAEEPLYLANENTESEFQLVSWTSDENEAQEFSSDEEARDAINGYIYNGWEDFKKVDMTVEFRPTISKFEDVDDDTQEYQLAVTHPTEAMKKAVENYKKLMGDIYDSPEPTQGLIDLMNSKSPWER